LKWYRLRTPNQRWFQRRCGADASFNSLHY